MSAIADNLAHVQERMVAAAQRSGRQAREVTLVAVTKKQPAYAIAEALAAGVSDIGENYVQEVQAKRDEIEAGRWHLLGHLQSNKAKLAISIFDLIQSVDSVKLGQAIGFQAQGQGRTQEVLLQVHLGEEETKSGFPPAEVRDAAEKLAAIPHLALRGLMGIAPNGRDARPYFRQIKALYDALPQENRQILSIGMTGDFETAIEEGATMIRVGTAIFGPRS